MRIGRILVQLRLLGAAGYLALTACRGHLAPPATAACASRGYEQDVDAAFVDIRDRYVYIDQKNIDWTRAESLARHAASAARSKRELVGVLERVLDNVYDAHAILRANTSHSPRLVPSGLDVWAEWRDGAALITAVRPGYDAEREGVRPGMQVLAINGVPILDAANARLGPGVKTPVSPEARAWALLSALAGRHDTPRVLRIRAESGVTREIAGDTMTPYLIDRTGSEPPVEARWIRVGKDSSDKRSYGYIRLNALGDSNSVPAFDSALATFRYASGLILDLRNTPGGGNTSVAEPILGRFITGSQGYQRVVPRNGDAYTRAVAARGPWTYDSPLVVLVGRWTGSMGEGMAIGLDGMHRGVVVGTPMAGLAGAVDDFKLPCSGLGIAFPTARLLHLDGTQRERWVPLVRVDLIASERMAAGAIAADSLRRETNASGDAVLRRGMEILEDFKQ
jgi:C-terminal processing protease CtpA/Prc